MDTARGCYNEIVLDVEWLRMTLDVLDMGLGWSEYSVGLFLLCDPAHIHGKVLQLGKGFLQALLCVLYRHALFPPHILHCMISHQWSDNGFHICNAKLWKLFFSLLLYLPFLISWGALLLWYISFGWSAFLVNLSII